jgi:hypothetical protein
MQVALDNIHRRRATSTIEVACQYDVIPCLHVRLDAVEPIISKRGITVSQRTMCVRKEYCGTRGPVKEADPVHVAVFVPVVCHPDALWATDLLEPAVAPHQRRRVSIGLVRSLIVAVAAET